MEKNNQGADGVAINPTLNLTIEQILASFGSAEIYWCLIPYNDIFSNGSTFQASSYINQV